MMRSIVFIYLILAGCASPILMTAAALAPVLHIADEPSTTPSTPTFPAEYARALSLFEERKFDDALGAFEDFLRQNPTSPYTQAASLNEGRTFEALGRWSDAIERYRAVIVACEGRAPKLQAMALYRLSFCHEALGDDQQSLAVLSDLMARKTFLPNEIARAELPARLAAAYARRGNFEKALEHYRSAESGMAQLRRVEGKAVPAWLPRTLYYMGTMSLSRASWNDFETSLRPLAKGQGYLLQSAEIGQTQWSDQAAKDLVATYLGLWSVIENPPRPSATIGDPLITEREIQQKQWSRAESLLANLNELRARFSPGGEPSASAKEIQGFVSDLDKKIQKLLRQRPVGEGLTPESKARRGRVRGRTPSPDPSLEKGAK